MEKPLFLSIAHLLNHKRDGMTATELAEELHLSVPTLYRATLEMFNLHLLNSNRKGKRIVYSLPYEIIIQLPKIYPTFKEIDYSNNKMDRLSITKAVAEEYNLPLNPRVTENMVISVIKEKIKENLPKGFRVRNTSAMKTLLNDSIKFDLCIGLNEAIYALDLKIIDTSRSLHERIGTISLLESLESTTISKIIIAYIILPINGKPIVDDNILLKAIDRLNSINDKVNFILIRGDRHLVLDSGFLNNFVYRIINEIRVEEK
jgi:DNA-binding transcriptional ArsR family regulator